MSCTKFHIQISIGHTTPCHNDHNSVVPLPSFRPPSCSSGRELSELSRYRCGSQCPRRARTLHATRAKSFVFSQYYCYFSRLLTARLYLSRVACHVRVTLSQFIVTTTQTNTVFFYASRIVFISLWTSSDSVLTGMKSLKVLRKIVTVSVQPAKN